jgi:hypothetical protein
MWIGDVDAEIQVQNLINKYLSYKWLWIYKNNYILNFNWW